MPPVDALADELIRTVDEAAPGLRVLRESAAAGRSPGRWSAKEILGHLIDSAANNHQRFVRAQQTDTFAFPGYEQDVWVRSQDHEGRPWLALVELWAAYNHHLAHIIRRIPPAALSVSCRIGTDDAVTLGALVEDYVRHMRHHLKQIRERAAVRA